MGWGEAIRRLASAFRGGRRRCGDGVRVDEVFGGFAREQVARQFLNQWLSSGPSLWRHDRCGVIKIRCYPTQVSYCQILRKIFLCFCW